MKIEKPKQVPSNYKVIHSKKPIYYGQFHWSLGGVNYAAFAPDDPKLQKALEMGGVLGEWFVWTPLKKEGV